MSPNPLAPRVKERPEECEIGDSVLPSSVPHWDGRIRLVEFSLADSTPGRKPWIFAATYKGMETLGWERVE